MGIFKHRKKAVFGIVFFLLFAVIVLVYLITLSEYSHFIEVREQAGRMAGVYGSGTLNFELDTKVSQIPYDEMDNVQRSQYEQSNTKVREAIKFSNRKFGFDSSLYSKMGSTDEVDGVQIEENKNYIVTWKYSSKGGLVVKYKLKNIF